MIVSARNRQLLIGVIGCFTFCFAAEPLLGQLNLRLWRDSTGQSVFRAELVGVQKDQVTLRRENGFAMVLPLKRLHPSDVEFAKAWQRKEDKRQAERRVVQAKRSAAEKEAKRWEQRSKSLFATLYYDGRNFVRAGIPVSRFGKTDAILIPPDPEKAADGIAYEVVIDGNLMPPVEANQALIFADEFPGLAALELGAQTDFQRVQNGSRVVVVYATPADGKLDVTSTLCDVHQVLMADQRVTGFEIKFKPPTRDALAIVFFDRKAIGVISPMKWLDYRKLKNQSRSNRWIVTATSIDQWFQADRPNVMASGAVWRNESYRPKRTAIDVFLAFDRPLGDDARLQLNVARGRKDGRILKQSFENQIRYRLAPVRSDDLKPLAKLSGVDLEQPFVYHAQMRPSDLVTHESLSQLQTTFAAGENRSQQQALDIGIVFTSEVPLGVQPELVFAKPRLPLTVNWTLTWTDTVSKAMGDAPAPKVESKEVFDEHSGVDSANGARLFRSIPSKVISDVVFDSQGRTAWVLTDGTLLRLLDLESNKVVRSVEIIQEPASSSASQLALNQQGLMIALDHGVLQVDRETLQTQFWLPGMELDQLVSSEAYSVAFGLSHKSVWVIDAAKGIPLHRIDNRFGSESVGMFGGKSPTSYSIRHLACSGKNLIAMVGPFLARLQWRNGALEWIQRSSVQRWADSVWISPDGRLVSAVDFDQPYDTAIRQATPNWEFDLSSIRQAKPPQNRDEGATEPIRMERYQFGRTRTADPNAIQLFSVAELDQPIAEIQAGDLLNGNYWFTEQEGRVKGMRWLGSNQPHFIFNQKGQCRALTIVQQNETESFLGMIDLETNPVALPSSKKNRSQK